MVSSSDDSRSSTSRICTVMCTTHSVAVAVSEFSLKVRTPLAYLVSSHFVLVLGGSHDRTDLLPLKAGVSIMALGAMANDPPLGVKIVPVGLSYFHAHKFRSRAVVEFGRAMDVPAEFVEMFKQGGAQKREAVGKFLDLIFDALKTVTVRAPDYDTLMVRARRYQHIWFHFIPAYSNGPPTVQDTGAASYTRAGGRIEQTIIRRL